MPTLPGQKGPLQLAQRSNPKSAAKVKAAAAAKITGLPKSAHHKTKNKAGEPLDPEILQLDLKRHRLLQCRQIDAFLIVGSTFW
jgi:hypothetical protein